MSCCYQACVAGSSRDLREHLLLAAACRHRAARRLSPRPLLVPGKLLNIRILRSVSDVLTGGPLFDSDHHGREAMMVTQAQKTSTTGRPWETNFSIAFCFVPLKGDLWEVSLFIPVASSGQFTAPNRSPERSPIGLGRLRLIVLFTFHPQSRFCHRAWWSSAAQAAGCCLGRGAFKELAVPGAFVVPDAEPKEKPKRFGRLSARSHLVPKHGL